MVSVADQNAGRPELEWDSSSLVIEFVNIYNYITSPSVNLFVVPPVLIKLLTATAL